MYAGFWKRTAAYLLDQLIFSVAYYILAFIAGFAMALFFGNPDEQNALQFISAIIWLGLSAALFLFYFVYLEASPWQATLGKRALGIKVTDENGNRVTFWRSLGRNLGMVLSSAILCIGYMMCGWTRKKQCLHDMLAGCLVVDNNYTSPQPGAPASKINGCLFGLAFLPLLLLLLGVAAALVMPAYMQSVEKVRMNEAAQLLRVTARAQEHSFLRLNHYVSSWTELDVSPKGAVNSPTFCTRGPQSPQAVHDFTGCGGAKGWAVTLGPRSVTAYRVNVNNLQYSLTVTYANPNVLRCTAKTPGAKRLCDAVNARAK